MGLPEVVHVEFEGDVHGFDRNLCGFDNASRFFSGDFHALRQHRDVQAVEHQVDGLHLVVTQVRDHAAERRSHAGKARHDSAVQADFLNQRRGMQRAAAAERHRDEFLWVVAALDRDKANGTRHARVCDAYDSGRGIVGRKPQRLTDMFFDRAARGIDVERIQLATERALCIDASEHDLRVGQGRPRVALPVTGGPRH